MKILAFKTAGCPACSMMEKTTLAKLNIPDLEIVPMMAERWPDLIEKYEINRAPTYIQLDEDGKEVKRASGFMSVDKFKATFNI